jgi:sugar phosphate isomerase/epimerase
MVKAEIGLSMLYCLGQPFKKMADEILRTDMVHVEIVDDGLHELDRQKVALLKSIGKSYKKKYSVHAPFAGINIALPSRWLRNATVRRLKKSIVNASALECQVWVFHPGLRSGISMFYPGADWVRNLESVNLLVRFARDYGVEAAIENVMEPFVLKNVDEFDRFYAEFKEDVGLVLDTGHANLYGQLEDFVKDFSTKIVHVHAHDNRGKSDEHLGIGYGNIDWKRFAGLLKKASYERIVMVESVERVEQSVQRLKELFV